MADDAFKTCALCGEFGAEAGCAGTHTLCAACVCAATRSCAKLRSEIPPMCPVAGCDEFLRAPSPGAAPPRRLARLVLLRAGESEYERAVEGFRRTMDAARVRNVFLVENAALRAVHDACAERLKREAAGDKAGANERTLFHATSRAAAGSIIREGFDAHRAGEAHGKAMGAGIYVANDARFSDGYSSPDGAGLRSMFVCSVLLGKAGQNSKSSGGQHVIFREQQVLPLYLIQYV